MSSAPVPSSTSYECPHMARSLSNNRHCSSGIRALDHSRRNI